MTITKKDLKDFSQAVLQTYDLSNLEIDRDIALNSIESELESNLNELNQNNVKVSRAKWIKIGCPDDYSEHVVSLTHDKKVICGIRHKGGNPDHPFVNIIPNFTLSSKTQAMEVYEKIKHLFMLFKPISFCIHTKQQISEDVTGNVFLVASVKNYLSRAPWNNGYNLALTKVSDDSYYDWYKKHYDEFHQGQIDFKNSVPLNSKEVMEESRELGLLYYGVINNENVGLIAADKTNFLGHSGVYFNEIMLTRDWKGKGLAKVLQQKFIKEHVGQLDFVWGTIDWNNKPSLKTALANNREAIRFESFIDIE